ncbi:hypothetical protein SAMN05518847_109227 [Paenibacillus sp. OV219]|nr:hypothetical protein SAMN05518847_109227 [Paenibacillus sp. OV219]
MWSVVGGMVGGGERMAGRTVDEVSVGGFVGSWVK